MTAAQKNARLEILDAQIDGLIEQHADMRGNENVTDEELHSIAIEIDRLGTESNRVYCIKARG